MIKFILATIFIVLLGVSLYVWLNPAKDNFDKVQSYQEKTIIMKDTSLITKESISVNKGKIIPQEPRETITPSLKSLSVSDVDSIGVSTNNENGLPDEFIGTNDIYEPNKNRAISEPLTTKELNEIEEYMTQDID